MIEEELVVALGRRARTEGVSKAALIRQFVREQVKPLPPIERDPIWDIVGMGRGSPEDSTRVDDVVYPRRVEP